MNLSDFLVGATQMPLHLHINQYLIMIIQFYLSSIPTENIHESQWHLTEFSVIFTDKLSLTEISMP